MKEIKILECVVSGYGGSGYTNVLVVCENKTLETTRCFSERDVGATRAGLEMKWRELDETQLDALIAMAPPVSKLCDHCGNNTIDGCIRCVNLTFCKKCDVAGIIEIYKEKFRIEEEERRSTLEREIERQKLERAEKDRARLYGSFHWRNGRYFKRLPDGSVSMMRTYDGKVDSMIIEEVQIPAAEWASIVASVSIGGETSERYFAALKFHGDVESSQ